MTIQKVIRVLHLIKTFSIIYLIYLSPPGFNLKTIKYGFGLGLTVQGISFDIQTVMFDYQSN